METSAVKGRDREEQERTREEVIERGQMRSDSLALLFKISQKPHESIHTGHTDAVNSADCFVNDTVIVCVMKCILT